MNSQRLGKGLRALIPQAGEEAAGSEVKDLELDFIEPNPYQPREYFDEEKLQELADSIKEFGLLEPVVVRAMGDKYELVVGERRLRAARLAGLARIPALLRSYDDKEMMQVALVENLQREDLNPIEEAEGYQRLIVEFGLTQEHLAMVLGKKRSTVANAVRLLRFEEEEKDLIRKGALSAGHAKVLLSVVEPQKRRALARKVVNEDLSVRRLEELVRRTGPNVPRGTKKERDPEIVALEDELRRRLGTKVTIGGTQGKGKIAIDYYSEGELERILDLLCSL